MAVDALLAGTVATGQPPVDVRFGVSALSETGAAFFGVGPVDVPPHPTVSPQTLRTNLDALMRTPSRRQMGFKQTVLANRVGDLLVQTGEAEEAVAYFRSLLARTVEELHEDEDRDTVREIRAHLAEAQAAGGDIASAVAGYRSVIDDRMRRLNSAPGTVGYISFDPVRKISEQLHDLGPAHPDVANTQKSLAHWQGEQRPGGWRTGR